MMNPMKLWTRRQADTDAHLADREHFTGEVTQLAVNDSTEPHPVRVYLVGFKAGARTHWHRHAGGQTLHVIDGSGRTQVRGQPEQQLQPGDTVTVEPGVEHWHGAAADRDMTHVAVSLGGTEWGDPPA